MKMSKQNFIDKTINFFNPGAGLRRMQLRKQQDFFKRAYEAAAKGRRTENWKPPASSASTEIQRALYDLRNRSRELARNNPYGFRAVKKITNNVVGIGIVPTPTGISKLQEKKIKTLWKKWANKTKCDFDEHQNFYGLQRLIMRTVFESGECIVRKRIINDSSNPLPLQLQVLEGDFIDTYKHGPLENDGWIFYGIEFSKIGKVVAYWLYDQHPGGDTSYKFDIKSNRYPADEIVHVFEKLRPGQFRGVPGGVASFIRMKDLDEYQDAQLIRQKIAACFTIFVTDNGLQVGGNANASEDDLLDKVEPGIIEHLPAGKQVTMAVPPGAEGYADYTKAVLREISAGYDMDYVSLTGDYSQTTFSSGRLGWIDFYKSVQDWQWNMMVPMCCDKIYGWFEQMAAVMGLIKAGQDIDVEWTTPRRDMINPEAETTATIDAVQNGLMSWSDAVLETGYTPEEQIEKMKKDKELFASNGLPNYADKSAMNAKDKTAKPQPADNNTNPDQ